MATAQGIEPTQPITEIEKCQPAPIAAPTPSMAPGPAERERGNKPSQRLRTEPAPPRANEGAVSEKGAGLTPNNEPMNDSHSDHADTMEVDCDHDQDRAQLKGEKSTPREATLDHVDERNTLRKAFPERPSRVLLEGEKRTLREAMPGQPKDEDSYEERFDRQAMNSPGLQGGEQQHSNKVEERQDKVAPPTVNEDEERPDVRCSSRICRPTEGLVISYYLY